VGFGVVDGSDSAATCAVMAASARRHNLPSSIASTSASIDAADASVAAAAAAVGVAAAAVASAVVAAVAAALAVVAMVASVAAVSVADSASVALGSLGGGRLCRCGRLPAARAPETLVDPRQVGRGHLLYRAEGEGRVRVRVVFVEAAAPRPRAPAAPGSRARTPRASGRGRAAVPRHQATYLYGSCCAHTARRRPAPSSESDYLLGRFRIVPTFGAEIGSF
jgi:hypothetical protein